MATELIEAIRKAKGVEPRGPSYDETKRRLVDEDAAEKDGRVLSELHPATIDRTAFLYLEPKLEEDLPKGAEVVSPEDFAHCGGCSMFVPGKKRCTIHGEDFEVGERDSCGLYVPGPTAPDSAKLHEAVTAEWSGFVRHEVQCMRCAHYEGKPELDAEGTCCLFACLNRTGKFAIPTGVKGSACCNAFVARRDTKE